MRRFRIHARGLFAVTVALSLSACGLTANQRQATATFAESASAYGELAAGEIAGMRDSAMAMQLTTYQLPYRGSDADVQARKYEELEGAFKPDRVALRVRAAHALRAYGQGLERLLRADNADEVRRAGDDLAKSLHDLPPSLAVLSEQQVDAVQKLVNSLGGLLLAEMKEDAIKGIVPRYAPQVNRLCALLSDEFNTRVPNLGKEYERVAGRLLVESSMSLHNEPANLTLRQIAIPAYHTGLRHKERVDTILPQARDSGLACMKANHALVEALDSDSLTVSDLKTFSAQVRSLHSAAKAFR